MSEETTTNESEETKVEETTQEVKFTITPEFEEKVEEGVAKALEAREAARKQVYFHGTQESQAELDSKEKSAEAYEFLRDAAKGMDARTSEVIKRVHSSREKAITGGVDANGGFLVPEVFETDIRASFDSYSELISDSNVINVNKPGRIFNLNELVTRVSTFRTSEDSWAGLTASTPTFSEPQIGIDGYGGAVTIFDNFIEDAELDIMPNLARQFGESLARNFQTTLATRIVTASGVVSRGIFVAGNGMTTVSQATTSSGYTAVGAQDIENMYFTAINVDHYQDANKEGKFYMSPLAYRSLRANVRQANDQDYLSLFDPVAMTFLGRPIVLLNLAPTPATTVSNPYIVYGNLSRIVNVVRKRGMTMKINTQGTSLDGVNLNYQLGRELVVSERIGHQLTEVASGVQLVTA